MGKNWLSPGFRFHPTDVELVKYYLKRKVLGKKLPFNTIAEVDIYKYAPWDLPDMSCLKTGDLKWFFYCPIEKKYARGARLNRATEYGYWKTTGKDRSVKYNEEVVAMIKTLVFHRGKAPRGDRTDWVMHEYRLEEKDLADRGIVQDTYVLCVVFKKDGMGPRNGVQYGAPFKEEDWSDDEDANLPRTDSLSGMSMLAIDGASSSCVPESLCAGPSIESSGFYTLPLVVQTNATVSVATDIDINAYAAPTCVDAPQVPMVADAKVVPALMETTQLAQVPQVQESDDNILSIFAEDDAVIIYDRCQMTGNANDVDSNAYAAPTCVDAPRVPVVADAKAVPALMEASQLAQVPQVQESNDNILSMLEIFTEDNAFNTYDRGQMTGNANDSFFKAQVSDDDDLLFMLASFTEDNNLNNVLYPFE